MKKSIIILFSVGIFFQVNAQKLNPYILGATSSKSVTELKSTVTSALSAQGLNVVGSYMPAGDKSRLVFIVSHSQLEKAVQQIGGLTGFAATLRVAITREGSVTNISYTNPVYWGNAYFREDFSIVKSNYDAIANAFDNAMNSAGAYKGTPFGSKKGEEADDLHKYHYMIGMPYFDDTNELK